MKHFDPNNPSDIDRFVDFYKTLKAMEKQAEKYRDVFKKHGIGFYKGERHNGVNVDKTYTTSLDQKMVMAALNVKTLDHFKSESDRWVITPVND